MQRQKKILIGKIAAIMAVVPIVILAHSTGPDPRKTGAPGDQTCAQALCHTGTPNTGGGKVEVAFPNGLTYTPGVKQTLIVTVTDTQERVYGFQLTARLAGTDNYATQQAGTFTPTGTSTFVMCEDGSVRDANPNQACPAATPLQFIEQSLAGPTNTFMFDWTPPATASGDIKIWVAGNAANGNHLADSGDHVYLANYTLTPSLPPPAKPVINAGGVVDVFNYQSGVASATFLGIFGTNLAPSTKDWSTAIVNGKLPMALDGVRVTVNGIPAAIVGISPGQVNVLAPNDPSVGQVQVVLTNDAGSSPPITVTKTQYLPSFYAPFAKDSAHLYVTSVQSVTGEILGTPGVEPRAVRPVRPGEVILLYGAGFGQTNPDSPMDSIGPVAPLAAKPVITFGQVQASFVDNGYMVLPGFVQFNLTVPNVPDGDYQLRANIGGILSSDKVYITVKR